MRRSRRGPLGDEPRTEILTAISKLDITQDLLEHGQILLGQGEIRGALIDAGKCVGVGHIDGHERDVLRAKAPSELNDTRKLPVVRTLDP